MVYLFNIRFDYFEFNSLCFLILFSLESIRASVYQAGLLMGGAVGAEEM